MWCVKLVRVSSDITVGASLSSYRGHAVGGEAGLGGARKALAEGCHHADVGDEPRALGQQQAAIGVGVNV